MRRAPRAARVAHDTVRPYATPAMYRFLAHLRVRSEYITPQFLPGPKGCVLLFVSICEQSACGPALTGTALAELALGGQPCTAHTSMQVHALAHAFPVNYLTSKCLLLTLAHFPKTVLQQCSAVCCITVHISACHMQE